MEIYVLEFTDLKTGNVKNIPVLTSSLDNNAITKLDDFISKGIEDFSEIEDYVKEHFKVPEIDVWDRLVFEW